MSKVVKLVDSLTHDGHEFKEGKKFRKTPHPTKSQNGSYLKWFLGVMMVLAAIIITSYFLVRHHATKHPYQPHIFKHGETIHHADIPATTKIGDLLITDTTAWEPGQYSFGDTVQAVYKPVDGYPLTGERIFQFIINDVVAYHHTTLENNVTFTIPIQEAVSNKYFTPDANCFMQVLLPSGDKGHFRVQSEKVSVGYGLEWVPGTYGSSSEKRHDAYEGSEVQLQLRYRYSYQELPLVTGQWTISRSTDKKTFTPIKVNREVANTNEQIVSVYFNADTLGTYYYRLTYSNHSAMNDIITETPLTTVKLPIHPKVVIYTAGRTDPGTYYPTENVFPTVFNVDINPENLYFEYTTDSTSDTWTHINKPHAKINIGADDKISVSYYVEHTLASSAIYMPRYRIRVRDKAGGPIIADSGNFTVRGEISIHVPKTATIYKNGSHTDTPYPVYVTGFPSFQTYQSIWVSSAPLQFNVELTIKQTSYEIASASSLQGNSELNINFNNQNLRNAGTVDGDDVKNATLKISSTNSLLGQTFSASATIDEVKWVSGFSTVTTRLTHKYAFSTYTISKVQPLSFGRPDPDYSSNVLSFSRVPTNYETVANHMRFSTNSAGVKQISFSNGSGIYYYWKATGTDVTVEKAGDEYTGDSTNWTAIKQTSHPFGYKLRYGASQYVTLTLINVGYKLPTYKATLTTSVGEATIFKSTRPIE